jgi:membrane associated rhomboid family serine protease
VTQRFFVYPLLFLAVLQLAPLLRGRDRRWYIAQIAQLSLVLLAALGAIYFEQDHIWVFLAWTFFLAFVLTPKSLARFALRWQTLGHWRRAARLWDVAARFAWGQLGQLYRVYAVVLAHFGRGDRDAGLAVLDATLARPMPAAVCGNVRVWKLSLLAARRDWDAAIAFYEGVEDWETALAATQARLLVARAYAEAGNVARGLRCLQFVALSPRTLGPLETQLWMTRIRLAALAGDARELATLLERRYAWQRGFERFAAYWRGRCALARGDRGEAVRLLTRAYSLTHLRDVTWRDAVQHYLERAQRGMAPTARADADDYRLALQALHSAERQSAHWRALMHLGRPGRVTVTLLGVFVAGFFGAKLAFGSAVEERFWLWVGNGAETIQHGEWWRLFTALFVHANWLHLLMNGMALWMFGSAIEKTMGHWRFLLIFLMAGAAGNFISAWQAHYDIAVGASGGIFGLIGAFAVAVWRLNGPIHAGLRRRLLGFLGVMVASDFTVGWLEPLVDNLAHAGGFAAGLLLSLALGRRIR